MAKRIRGSAFALVVLSAVACGGSDDEADTSAGTAGSSNGAGGSSAGASGSAGKAGSATGGAAGKGGSTTGGAGGSTAGSAGSTTTGGGAGSAGKGDTAAPTFAGVKSATAMGEKQAVLAWDPATDNVTGPGAIAYRIYLAKTVGGQDFTKPYATTPAGSKGAVVSGLDASTKYSFVVRAVDQAGNEDKNTAHAETKTTDTTPPTFSGVSKVTGVNGTSIKVDWPSASDTGTPADQIKYRVFLANASGAEDFTKPAVETAPGAITTTLTGLSELQTYYVMVRAVDAAGNVDNNLKEKSAATADATAPTFAGAKAATASGATIKLDWDPAKDNLDSAEYIAYDIYAAKASGGQDFTKPTFTTQVGSAQPVVKYTFTGLDLNTTYFYVIRARDTAGNQEKNTKEVSATTASKADVTAPVFAGLTAVIPQNATTAQLVWDAANDETTAAADIVYDIFYAATPGGEVFTTPTYTTKPGDTAFTVTNLVPKSTNYYVVRARDVAGNSDANTVEKSGLQPPDTTAPTFAGIESATPVGPTSIKLSWADAKDDADPASGIQYVIYQASASGAEDFGAPIATTGPGETTFLVSGLTPETPYYFVVRAKDSAGNTESNTKEATTSTLKDTTPPTFAGAVSAVAQGPTSILVSWSPASDDTTASNEITYEVYVGGSSGNESFGSPNVTNAGDTSLLITGLAPATTYFFVVRAKDKYGNIETNVIEVSTASAPDTTGPVFAGATGLSGASATGLTVNWAAATDNVTPTASIVYSICYTQTAGGCSGASFTANGGTATGGATSKAFTALSPNVTYYFVVRARDAAGNWDNAPGVVNSVQQSGKTTTDGTPPTFAGLSTATQAGASKVDLSWVAGTDNVDAPGQIKYDIYWSTSATPPACVPKGLAGGQLASVTGLTTYQVTGLTPSTTYYFFVRARDSADNRECNTVVKSAATPADTTPPTGGTALAASPATCTSINVTWTQATDDVTANANIAYDVCGAKVSGGCNSVPFPAASANILRTTVTGGLSTSFTGLTPGQTWYFVVRARDGAGITNNNVTQVSATPVDGGNPVFSGIPSFTAVYGSPAARASGTWSAASDGCWSPANIHYEICHVPNSSGVNCTSSWKAMITTGAGVTSVTNSLGGTDGLSPNTAYTWYVRAVDGSGNQETGNHNSSMTTGISYSGSVQPIFTGTCNVSGCHAGSPFNYAKIAPGNASFCSPYNYVVAGNTASSFIWRKVALTTPGCGALMPYGASTPDASVRDPIATWITQGAFNNL